MGYTSEWGLRMKFAILDDENSDRERIVTFLERFVNENSVDLRWETFSNPTEFLENYIGDFDLIFLDIAMPGVNGIEVAREIRKKDQKVILIFITSLGQFALQGYEVEALDFVVKPIAYEEFCLKMKRALRYLMRDEDASLFIRTTDGVVRLQAKDVFLIEVRHHYLHYKTSTGEYRVRGTIREAEQALMNYNFVRCNQGSLVNLKYVETIKGNVVVVAGNAIPISRNKRNDFMTIFAKYVGGLV